MAQKQKHKSLKPPPSTPPAPMRCVFVSFFFVAACFFVSRHRSDSNAFSISAEGL